MRLTKYRHIWTRICGRVDSDRVIEKWTGRLRSVKASRYGESWPIATTDGVIKPDDSRLFASTLN